MKRRTASQMRPIVKKWEQSSQPKSVFCQQHGIKIDTFNYWLKQLSGDLSEVGQSNQKLISLQVSGKDMDLGKEAIGQGIVTVYYPNGVRVVFHELSGLSHLSKTLQITI